VGPLQAREVEDSHVDVSEGAMHRIRTRPG
jgi:hypothetical protein